SGTTARSASLRASGTTARSASLQASGTTTRSASLQASGTTERSASLQASGTVHMADAQMRVAFLQAALWHGSLAKAREMLAAGPELATSEIHTAAVVGDDGAVRLFLERDPSSVHATSDPYGGEPLVYLCLSKFLRLDPSRSDAFLRTATALLDAGADPNSGFWTRGEHPERETALYGAAGVAHHAAMTKLLIERGADPNDGEVAYHSPETRDNAALRILVETERLTRESLRLMLLRKIDWHDHDGVKYLIEHG